MSSVGPIVKGRCKVRCDGCGRISSDRQQGYFVDANGRGQNITSKGRECEHDFCDTCEERLHSEFPYSCSICGRSTNAVECGAEVAPLDPADDVAAHLLP